jgi:hypothetical protein
MKGNPKAIPGIHNYCDRWCERCYFTSRCNVFENTRDSNPEEQDIHNKAFWERISNQFNEAIQLLYKAAADQGFDLLAIPAEELKKAKRKEKQLQDKSEKHPLSNLSMDYAKAVMNWLKTTDNLKTKQDELLQHLSLGILPVEHAKEQVATIQDCLEIIQWYLHFIHVKLMRAITGKLGDDGWEEKNGFQNDYDGSAKIALIAVERSLQAWFALHQLIPPDEDKFFKIVGMLQKIKIQTEQEFPKAYQFIRPGFDEQ